MEFYANYVVTNVPDMFKGLVIHEHSRVYNDLCNEINPLLEKWNDEYDELFNMKGLYKAGHYENWIAKKYMEIIKSKPRSKFMTFTVDDEVVVHGHVNGLQDSDVYFYITDKKNK